MRRSIWAGFLTVALQCWSGSALAQVQVTTQHNDNGRTGQNLQETTLTTANVNVQSFGKLWTTFVDGQVYAQPLYVPNVTIPGKGVHNVFYVATEHDSVYAFDADSNSGENGSPLWHTSFIDPGSGITTMSIDDVNCNSAVVPEYGVTSTPVIDTSTNTIYILVATKENGNFFNRLHALDITTGAEKFDGPVTIQATYPGTGAGSVNGVLTFDPLMQMARSGLLLSNGQIYMAWASYCDNAPFHGWVMAYDKSTLQQTAVWADTPNGEDGGIWMSGAGLTADASGNIILSTGNGTFDVNGSPVDFGDSIVKMALNGSTLSVSDYFTPDNQAYLDLNDIDVASGGVLLLPDQPGPYPHEAIGGGKDGNVYIVNRDNMGHYNPSNNSQIIQTLSGSAGMWASPAYWNENVYFGWVNAPVQAFSVSNGLLSPTSTSLTSFYWPGASLAISANNNTNAILWGLNTSQNDESVLYAYDATNVATELYTSAQNGERDSVGLPVKYAVPTVANGKVYVGAVGQVSVYGILSAVTPTPTFTPAGGTYTSTQTVVISDSTPGATIYYTTDGSTPSPSSPVYTAPLIVSATTAVNAIAIASGAAPSDVGLGAYTITSGGGGTINYENGLSSSGLHLNGSATMNGSRVRLTNGGQGEAGTAWYTTKVNIQAFTQDFSFQLTNPHADGITFTIQNAGPTALGGSGGYLGYAPITPSVAIKFDLANNNGEGIDSTGIYTDGALPYTPAIDMTGTGIDLHSSHVFNVHMTYDGATLTMQITDANTQQNFVTSWAIDIPGTVGGTTAYAGFTGGSGSTTAIQEILSWSFVPQADVSYGGGFYPTGMALNGSAKVNGSSLQLTDGGQGETASAWYATPVNVQAFTQNFSFQLTNPQADGITFTIQNAGLTALGGSGGWLGYAPIPSSVAVKFDLYNNDGEGMDSTGLYVNGAKPYLPAVDMTASGVNLHSGDVFNVHMSYDGTTLTMQITDASTLRSFVTSWPINIPATVGGPTAYVGFTGGTGGKTAVQNILSWSYSAVAGVNYNSGFNAGGMVLNGRTMLNNSRLRLTDGGQGEAASAWYAAELNVQAFVQDFSFQLTNPNADGITFAIQNAGPSALGGSGGWLGYAPIGSSVAVKFDLYNNAGEGVDSTGLYLNGAIPYVPALDMTSSGVDLHSGDVFNVHMVYDGATLNMQITDAGTQQSFATSWTINIPATVGSPTAYAGFTGGTGSTTATQEILSWSFVPLSGINYSGGFNSHGLSLNGKATVKASRLRLTDGEPGESASAWYTTPVNIQNFTQDFSFQLTNPDADGITFTIQNAGTTALGGSGGWLGYAPIGSSVAVKFDLYNNAGEGVDSTGLYVKGALPYLPAVDMTGSGVNLHSGDVFNVHMVYGGGTLTMEITDATTLQSFGTSWMIDIPGTVGGPTALAGFTGGTGGQTATQDILSWSFVPAYAPPALPGSPQISKGDAPNHAVRTDIDAPVKVDNTTEQSAPDRRPD
jgi:hypothetical protein